MSITDSQAFASLEEADDFAAEGWPDNEDIESESAWDTEEDTDWEDYPADEIDEDYAGESIAIENYADTEYDQEAADFGELDTYHEPRRAHGTTKAGSALAAAIAETAEQEYRRWRPSGGKSLVETDPAATPILQDYYRTGVGMNVVGKPVAEHQLPEGSSLERGVHLVGDEEGRSRWCIRVFGCPSELHTSCPPQSHRRQHGQSVLGVSRHRDSPAGG